MIQFFYSNTRYNDDIFFTSNEAFDTINQMLDEANQFHPNIKLVRQLGTSVSFLDIYIENKKWYAGNISVSQRII